MGEGLLGNRLNGYTDVLASSTDSILLSLQLMLPYAGATLYIASSFVWWLLLGSIAFTSGKILFRQADSNEMVGKLALGFVILIVFFPIKYKDTSYELPLASYLTIGVIQLVDQKYREGIDAVASSLTGNGQKLPISMIRTLNQSNLNVVDGSRLSPIVNDYVANCTVATTLQDPETNQYLSEQEWRVVGLYGAGLLGFEPSDYVADTESTWSWSFFAFGMPDDASSRIDANFTQLRERAIRIFNTIEFPQSFRGYTFPTEDYWRGRVEGEANSSTSPKLIELPRDARFLSTADYDEYQRTGQVPETTDLSQWHADDCYELYYLSQQGTRNYLKGLQGSYRDVFARGVWNTDETTAVAAGSHAVRQAMKNFYTKSANRESGVLKAGERPVSQFISEDQGLGGQAYANGMAAVQGSIYDLASILLNIGLDQWILTLLGSLSVAIAFLAVIFPFFVLVAPLVGGESIIVVLKTMVMLEVTLMLSYLFASIGILLISAINIVSTNAALSAYGMSDGMTTLTVAIMTGMFIFPLVAAKLAHMLVFGSNGVREADGRTTSLGKQAALAGSVVGAMAAVIPGAKAAMVARAASGAMKSAGNKADSAGSGSSGGGSAAGFSSGSPGGLGGASSGPGKFNRGQGRLSTPRSGIRRR